MGFLWPGILTGSKSGLETFAIKGPLFLRVFFFSPCTGEWKSSRSPPRRPRLPSSSSSLSSPGRRRAAAALIPQPWMRKWRGKRRKMDVTLQIAEALGKKKRGKFHISHARSPPPSLLRLANKKLLDGKDGKMRTSLSPVVPLLLFLSPLFLLP